MSVSSRRWGAEARPMLEESRAAGLMQAWCCRARSQGDVKVPVRVRVSHLAMRSSEAIFPAGEHEQEPNHLTSVCRTQESGVQLEATQALVPVAKASPENSTRLWLARLRSAGLPE